MGKKIYINIMDIYAALGPESTELDNYIQSFTLKVTTNIYNI